MIAIMTRKTNKAFEYGVTDAAAGIPCSPTLYFSHPGDLDSYVAGYHSTKAAPVLDDSWELAAPPASRDDRIGEAGWQVERAAEYDRRKADTEDYQEYMRDIEWLRQGC